MLRFLVALLIWLATASAQELAFSSRNGRLQLGTDAWRTASVRLGDLDGDHDLDVVVANGRHWPEQNFVFLNSGGARFQVARRLGEDLVASYAAELADLDGDSDLDIVVGNDMAPNAVFENDGAGRFLFKGSFGEPSSVRRIKLADIDQDGDVDILAVARRKRNQIYLNDGHGTFSRGIPFGEPGDSTIDVAVAHVNDDPHLDLILANRDQQQNVVLLGASEARFETGAYRSAPGVMNRVRWRPRTSMEMVTSTGRSETSAVETPCTSGMASEACAKRVRLAGTMAARTYSPLVTWMVMVKWTSSPATTDSRTPSS